jgi:hypothetical protein
MGKRMFYAVMSLCQGQTLVAHITQTRISLSEIDRLGASDRRWRNLYDAPLTNAGMVDVITLGILAAVLLFFFFMYLMLRRTFMGFKEGFQQSKEK